jgi:hypothetical protein
MEGLLRDADVPRIMLERRGGVDLHVQAGAAMIPHLIGCAITGAVWIIFWHVKKTHDIDLERLPLLGHDWRGSVAFATLMGIAWLLLAWR